jgi:hypothetical protein
VTHQSVYTFFPPSQLHPNAESLRFSGGANDTKGVGGISGMIIHDPDLNKVILAFAGTQVTDLLVWAKNLHTELIDYPPCGAAGCQVHAGFYADYQVGMRETEVGRLAEMFMVK